MVNKLKTRSCEIKILENEEELECLRGLKNKE